ncbi:MAG: hypothetical protein RL660_1096 [Bacteroidota bacterium]|jgi:NTE family protein
MKAFRIIVLTTLTLTNFVHFCAAQTSNNKLYTNLVMEGSGVKLFSYIGALQVLDSAKHLSQIKNFGGTSGGCVMASLLCVGYTCTELDSIAYSVKVQTFADAGKIYNSRIKRINKNFGFYKGDAFVKWMENLVAAKTGNANITLLELHQLALQGKAKDLFAVATDLSTQTCVVLSHRTFPNMRIVDAVRCSMSIPLAYKAVLIDKQGKTYSNIKDADSLHVLVDGGALHNYPIDMFDTITPQAQTLGIMIENDAYLGLNERYVPITNFKTYTEALYHTTVEKPLTSEANRARSIIITMRPISARIKKIPKESVQYMIQQGKLGAQNYLNSKQH